VNAGVAAAVAGGERGSGGGQWSRGQAPPKPQQNRGPGGRQQRGGRGGGPQSFYDGPVAPLIKSENHWRPTKNTNALVVAEKQVKSILNKMTKEKFDRLSEQMLQVPIKSAEILRMMINNVFDKAIDEPSFGDMYADLCVRLSQSAQASSFIHIIESDEEPPTEDGASPAVGESSSYTVYRWSNDVSTSDDQIVGPFSSVDECFDVALSEEEETPQPRGDMALELVSVTIRRGIFVKVMQKKEFEEGEKNIFYTVYFPVSEAKECGQQLSDIFLSDVECVSDANKKNRFKTSLLNKCEEEFNKQDIYAEWKKEKKEYEKNKKSMAERERAEKEEELDFRRIRIKKQMLGNVKFIGQLYKKGMLKEKIMRFCIGSLLKLESISEEKAKSPEYKDTGDTDMDEEDHEAICSIFTTIGATIDTPAAATFMNVCFTKIAALANAKSVPSRSRFLYKDLLELRENRWVPRRKVEKAKTLEEIRKDVEQEERRQAQLAASRPGGGRVDFAPRSSVRGPDVRQQRPSITSSRPRQAKPAVEVDDDGFMKIGSKDKFTPSARQPKAIQSRNPAAPNVSTKPSVFAALADDSLASPAPNASATTSAAPLDKETLKRKIKSMRNDFISDGGNVDELLLSFEEVSGTPDAGRIIVSNNMDRLVDCKDTERSAIVRIICVLFEKGKISTSDIESGLTDTIEFIDSIVFDAPRVFEFVGEVLSEMLRIKAIDMNWICEQCEKTKSDPTTQAPERLITETMKALKKSSEKLEEAIAKDSDKALVKLLGEDAWNTISETL